MKQISLIFGFFWAVAFIACGQSQEEKQSKTGVAVNEHIFTYMVGDLKVSLLSEGQQTGDKRILIDAPDEVIQEYTDNGKYPNAVNAFLIEAPEGKALIDTGHGRELFNNLHTLGVSPEDIHLIVLTHMHGDHIGGLLKDGEIAFPNAQLLIAQNEVEYWQSQSSNSRAAQVMEKYQDKIEIFHPKALSEIKIGSTTVYFIQAYGHTPGHTAILLNSQGEDLLIWGDLTHAMAVQMPHPEIAVTYDTNPEEARKSRVDLLRFAAENKIPIAGMHIAYPAMGTISTAEVGYLFTPTRAD